MKFAVAARIALIALGFEFSALSLIAAPVKLNGSLTLGGDVDRTFQFSADGSRILYVADQDTDQVLELYGVSSAGGAPQKLSGTLVNGGDVLPASVRSSPDGSRVVYAADEEVLSHHCAAREVFPGSRADHFNSGIMPNSQRKTATNTAHKMT